jgi:hypothetical protein
MALELHKISKYINNITKIGQYKAMVGTTRNLFDGEIVIEFVHDFRHLCGSK